MFSVALRRLMPRRPRLDIDVQMERILDNLLNNSRGTDLGWVCISKKAQQKITERKWIGHIHLEFQKTKGETSNSEVLAFQWNSLKNSLEDIGKNAVLFNKYPWKIYGGNNQDVPIEQNRVFVLMNGSPNGHTAPNRLSLPLYRPNEPQIIDAVAEEKPEEKVAAKPSNKKSVIPANVLTVDDLKGKFPYQLLNASDAEIEAFPAFKGIYGRGPHIRSVLSSIHSFLESDGERANHTLLWGLPACAKTAILLRLLDLFGEGAVLRLDSTNTTRAGLERLIFKDMKQAPLIWFCEEIEKADEQFLRVWLGAMDERHEFLKVNYRTCDVQNAKFISLATVNDKNKFDMMMGGRPGYAGALSSRFVHHLECHRPTKDQMRKILGRDIEKNGGDIRWIEPCIELSEMLETDDPRKILGFLDGRDRLLDGSYQIDQLEIYRKGKQNSLIVPNAKEESCAPSPLNQSELPS